jgi:hypothetical protein
MINIIPSTDYKTVVTWSNDVCTAVVDIGTVDATSAVQLKLLLEKLGTHPNVHLEFNEEKGAVVQWRGYVHSTLDSAEMWHDKIVSTALYRLAVLKDDIAEYNHICSIREAADGAWGYASKEAA